MPNAFAFIAVFGWPVAVYLLFRYLPRVEAICWSIFGGYLLLPTRTGLDLPLVPTLDKDAVPALTAAFLVAIGMGVSAAEKDRQAISPVIPADGGPWSTPFLPLFLLLLVTPIITVLNNSEPISYGPLFLPGLRIHDALSFIARMAFTLVPFLLAMRYLASPESHVTLLKVTVLAMLIYSLPTLFEIRMSPQLNVMFYGFFPHAFEQHMRAGGFRPLVFLTHGLWLAILLAMAVIASLALWRHRMKEGARAGQWLFGGIYLLLVLFLANSLGAMGLTLMLAPAVIFLVPRGQMMLAGVIAVVVLLYPVLRSTPLLPVDRIVSLAASISEERAQSLQFRLANEDALSARAAEKPLAGWGMWGRNEIHDPETGRVQSVTDGVWIIVIGTFGWLGFLGQFGLLTLPILMLAFGRRASSVTYATSGLTLVMATNLLDLLPNATLTPITWLIGGALAGFCTYRVPAEGPVAGPLQIGPKRSWGVMTDRQHEPRPMTPGASPAPGTRPGWHPSSRAAQRLDREKT